MSGPAHLSHPAITLIAQTDVSGLEDRIHAAPWNSTIYLAAADEPGPATGALIVRIDRNALGPDEDLDRLAHDGLVWRSALDTSTAQSIAFARVEHFDFAGKPRPTWVQAFLHYLAHDAYILPAP